MKTCLIDMTNYGVVHVIDYQNKWHMSLLRSCIVDTVIGRIPANHSLYAELNNESIRQQFYQSTKIKKLYLGNAHEINDLFLQKQRLAPLMMPPILALTEALAKRSFDTLNEHGLVMDDTLAFEISNSDPLLEKWSYGVLEYANTMDITPQEAYTELRIEYESTHAIKMRTYAVSKKYQRLIRAIRTPEDSAGLVKEINEKLLTDTFI
jgi:hypothetical protein